MLPKVAIMGSSLSTSLIAFALRGIAQVECWIHEPAELCLWHKMQLLTCYPKQVSLVGDLFFKPAWISLLDNVMQPESLTIDYCDFVKKSSWFFWGGVADAQNFINLLKTQPYSLLSQQGHHHKQEKWLQLLSHYLCIKKEKLMKYSSNFIIYWLESLVRHYLGKIRCFPLALVQNKLDLFLKQESLVKRFTQSVIEIKRHHSYVLLNDYRYDWLIITEKRDFSSFFKLIDAELLWLQQWPESWCFFSALAHKNAQKAQLVLHTDRLERQLNDSYKLSLSEHALTNTLSQKRICLPLWPNEPEAMSAAGLHVGLPLRTFYCPEFHPFSIEFYVRQVDRLKSLYLNLTTGNII